MKIKLEWEKMMSYLKKYGIIQKNNGIKGE